MLGIVLCVYDKAAAKKRRRRVRESFLFAVGFMGGAAVMYAAMLLIRHKTKHLSFMVSFPLMIALHIALVVFLGFKYSWWL